MDSGIRYLKGVGETRIKLFKKLGVETLFDLLHFFPRDYEDRTVLKNVSELLHGESVCAAAVIGGDARLSKTAGNASLVRLRAADDTGVLELYFFNRPYVSNVLRAGERYVFYGKVEREGRVPRMVNPVFEAAGDAGERTGRLVPVYRLTAGLSQYHVSGAVKAALDYAAGSLPDAAPRYIREKYGLAEIAFAFENIHFPKDLTSLAVARRRLMFDELFTLSAAARGLRERRDVSDGRVFTPFGTEEFYAALPFAPTDAQRSAVNDAVSDLVSGSVMRRLIQGDVGSGKTVVAMILCWLAAKNGTQAAFMAPTELLAEQHFRTFEKILSPLGVRSAVITGGLSKKIRGETQKKLAAGEIDVVIGTHALFSESMKYKDLSLVITDEQHRFGVTQRARLGEKGGSPHVLVMSATPIPRTLALILYGDLDISVIGELPPGRRPVRTFAVGEDYRERIYNFTRKLINEGRQVYFICPAIETGETSGDLKAVREYSKHLAEQVFPEFSVGLVHGAMKPREKDAEMLKFVSGETQILVATTVVEVGVDVPNAALIVIENADRYGLSQLHQLRGRVGRGEHESYCVMFEGAGEAARERLKTLCETNDGFKIAEEDLRQRGPGDFFGSRQHGMPVMRFAEALAGGDIAVQARDAAGEVLRRDPPLEQPEHQMLRTAVERILNSADGTFN